jgi:hypothetical protein
LVAYSPRGNNLIGDGPNDTLPQSIGSISITNVGSFTFDPKEVMSVRPDIFQAGYFSIFDILVHLDNLSEIDLTYHFDQEMNTHVIEDLNGRSHWWYSAFYSGGWAETSIFRMDHYPYKDKMSLQIVSISETTLESYYEVYREEVQRKMSNNKQIIIPSVILRKYGSKLVFENVKVTPHNLRNDTFQNGTITAIDVIQSLGDQGEINYTLQWYEKIGSAEVVKSYWVESINSWNASGSCGFVYEAGPLLFSGFRGNHIHIPSDWRVLNSPEYVEFYWIELGPC